MTSLILSRPAPGQAPEFTLAVSSVIGSLHDNGMLAHRACLADLLQSLTPESRSHLNLYPRHRVNLSFDGLSGHNDHSRTFF